MSSLATTAWRDEHTRQVQHSLAWSQAYLHSRRHDPPALQRHARSFLALLHSALNLPALHAEAQALALSLHPWPLRWGLWDEWLALVRRAAECSHGSPPLQVQLQAHLSQLLFDVGRLEAAQAAAIRTIELAQTPDIPPETGTQALDIAGAALAPTLMALGQIEAALTWVAHIEAALAAAYNLPAHNPPATTEQMARLGPRLALHKALLLRRQSLHSQGIALADTVQQALQAAEPPDRSLLALAHQMRATLRWSVGAYPSAVQDLQQAIRLFQAVGDNIAEVMARGNLGLVYWSMAELDLAESHILQSIAQTERLKAGYELIRQIGNMVGVCFARGELTRGMQYVERQLQLAQLAGDAEEIARALGNRGGLWLYLGQFEAAEPDLRHSLAQYQHQQRSEALCGTYVDLAYLLAHTNRPNEGLDYARQALALAEQMEITTLQIIALRVMAECLPLAERAPWLRQALALAEQYGRRLDQAGCLLSLAQATNDHAAWQRGAALLEAIGGQAWIEERSLDNAPCIALLI